MLSDNQLLDGLDFYRLEASHFFELEKQWEAECRQLNEDYASFGRPQIDHARSICQETNPDPRYGVFGMQARGRYELIIHLNRAQLPGPAGHTLRVLWFLGSPRHKLFDDKPAELVDLTAGLLTKILMEAHGAMRARYIKIHASGTLDMPICNAAAQQLPKIGVATEVSTKGSWLHIAMA